MTEKFKIYKTKGKIKLYINGKKMSPKFIKKYVEETYGDSLDKIPLFKGKIEK